MRPAPCEGGLVLLVGPQRAAALLGKIEAGLANSGHRVRLEIGVDNICAVQGVADTVVLVCVTTSCGQEQMDAMPRLRGIVSPLLGYDWIDVEQATRRGIPVVNGDIAENRESMAEATIMLMLALLYRLPDTEAQLRAAGDQRDQPRPRRHMLKGRTVGIIGYGGIARAMVDRLRSWGPRLLVATRSAPAAVEAVQFVGLDELLATSDVVVVMTSLDRSNRHLINAATLRQMKAGVLLVNTARGGLIDEPSLIEALHSGHVAAAALDVFEVEPLPAEHPFRRCPNLILTPHAVGHTLEMIDALPIAALENTSSLLEGRLPSSCRNPEVTAHGAWSLRPKPSSHRAEGSV